MPRRERPTVEPHGEKASVPAAGIVRTELVGTKPARTLRNLFANLREVNRGEIIGQDPDRNAEGTRLRVDRTEGHGSLELYRLDRDLYVLTIDSVFDGVREEAVAGEGLLEFHVCLRGQLTMQIPGIAQPVIAQGPCLLLVYQPAGVDITERVEAGIRYTATSLYCRPAFLSDLIRRNGIRNWPLLHAICNNELRTVWHRIQPLSSGLQYVATSLLQSPFRHGFRLLDAEAKALELLCQVLSPTGDAADDEHASPTESVQRRLDSARRILGTQFNPIPHISDVARTVGMSESKLKREFKAQFGATIFEYGLECRMRYALELLRSTTMSICRIAEAAGYQHQTSFTAAFRDYYGFVPRDTRGSVH